MPGRDGTGPIGQGFGNANRTNGVAPRGVGVRDGGDCECPKCGTKVPHQRGVPCTSISCPKCNTTMLRGE